MLAGEEIKEAYNFLTGALEGLNLGWVVQQAEEKIRSGNIVEVDIAEGRAKTKYQKIAPYSEAERLRILIDAIRKVVVELSQVSESVRDFFHEQGVLARIKHPQDIRFASEEGDTVHALIPSQERKGSSEALAKLLSELEREI